MHGLPNRRALLRASLAVASLSTLGRAPAQTRQDPVRVLCGYPPGGSVDVVARRLAERLARGSARPTLVDNRPGAAGRIAVEALRGAAPDGATLLVTPASVLTMYPHIYRHLHYDVFADLAPVAMVASTEFCLAVGPAVPAEVVSMRDFAAWCQAHPDRASCGNAGAGSFPHFMALLLARETGIALNHVPFRGGSAAMVALAGGQVASALSTEGSALALEQGGKIRVIATTAAARSVFFQKAPSFAELGWHRLVQREWFAVVVPARTPAPVVDAVAADAVAMLADPDVRGDWARLGLITTGSTPAELRSALRSEFDFWGPIVKSSGFTPEA